MGARSSRLAPLVAPLVHGADVGTGNPGTRVQVLPVRPSSGRCPRAVTAWTMLHKLRSALGHRPEFRLSGLVEADEAYVGGAGS